MNKEKTGEEGPLKDKTSWDERKWGSRERISSDSIGERRGVT